MNSYNVFYQGKVLCSLNASTKWEAIERVSSRFYDVDRTKLIALKY
jgi:hypothetical protein